MHTPGPWLVYDKSKCNVISGGGRVIASTGGYQDGTEKTANENMSNARLIAAAPDLLEALNNIDQIACYPADMIPGGSVSDILSAIHEIAFKAMNEAEGRA